MGASVNEGIFSTPDFNINSQFDDDRRSLKPVYDNVHGNIYLNPICLKFVDTEQFQRLRDLKQLGLSNMVYPGAVHSRFEHSLGVYWLAGEAVQQLKADQGQELDINRFDIQTVKLAGLLHDIGHGPFSHLFEREFLPRVGAPTWSHEDMSAKLVDYMVDENSIEIPDDMLKKAKGMILASSETGFTSSRSSGEKRFLYDIVANGRNGIDVDKFDYIVRDSRACGLGCNFQFKRLMENMRVIDDEICYRAKEYLTIHKLFYTRADLYRTVYTHPKIKAIEMMFVDALVKANSYLDLSSKVNEPSEYWKLDDTILKNIEVSTDPELKESRDLIRRIRTRNLYQFCNDYVVPKEQIENFRDITAKDIICSQKSSGVTLREEDVAVCNVKIDLSRGMRNPLESINFFQDYDSGEKFPISNHQVSNLLPTFSQDKIVRVYAKKDELVKDIADAFVNFQEKTFGRTVQICATPEKKKRKRSDHRGNTLPRTSLKFL